jgi:hypothetical protein
MRLILISPQPSFLPVRAKMTPSPQGEGKRNIAILQQPDKQ